MKTSKDPRHLRRIKVMQQLFAWDFNENDQQENSEMQDIVQSIQKIDSLISGAAPTWPIEKINKIDLAVLRLAVYELIIKPEQPSKVIVDEAVELAKEFGSDASPSFINGVLGKLITDQGIE